MQCVYNLTQSNNSQCRKLLRSLQHLPWPHIAKTQTKATARAANPTLHQAASLHSTLFPNSTSYINQKITRFFMFNQYEPNIKATIKLLKLLKVKVTNTTVNETLQNHPDWPSMLCISDSLKKWNIPNGVGQIELANIDHLPTPFIVHTNNRENPLAIVTQVTDTAIYHYQKKHKKIIIENRETFLKKWYGVYLIAEPTEHSGEANYKANKQKELLKKIVPAIAIATLLFFSLIGLKNSATNTIGIYMQYFILLAGVVVSTLLLWYEIDKSNPFLQKVCRGIAKGNCNAILTGKAAKVFSWLSWSEVGFFYFTGSLLALLFIPNAIGVLAWLNIIALPYTLFSVYYQWRVAKQWCVLCLAVQALLLLGATNVVANNFVVGLQNFSPSTIIYPLALFAMAALIWYSIKPFVLKLQEAKTIKRQYLRLKFNSEIFDTLLKKQKQITIPTNDIGINIGTPAATNTIIKVCNPYCGPCATAHPKIDALIEQNKNINAKIIFTTANNETDKGIKPVKHLLAVAAQNSEQKTKQALDDWYLAEKKEYDFFATKYPMNGELEQQGYKIEAMAKWCNETDITFTPTVFINGYQLPDAYSIEDLEYFLQE